MARHADAELHRRLADGQFCYVLTSRQMGKSSLMNRVSTRLHREGVAVADIDLTTIGQNLTVEQWYDGLIYEIGRSLNLKPQLRAAWQANAELGPLQRFIATMRDALLTTFFQPVVIFVDEIEVVSGLSFSTDEFFAAIRECYNRRASDPEMRRLTFCLLGMATPQDLVQDPRITPFNIGHRIDLTDFTFSEASPLAAGMCEGGRDGNRLLTRVLYWTHGQPYLTQRLCQAVAQDSSVNGDAGVDQLCHRLFLSERAREDEPNLVPLREYVLRSAPDRAALLDSYSKVLAGKRVVSDAADVNVGILQLAGFTRAERGFLRPRNRIYARVFDKRWIRTNMPDAELRRQRAAFWRAFALNASVFGSITAAAIVFAVMAYIEQRTTSEALYVADMKIANTALDKHNVDQVRQILRKHAGDPMAGFEYGYLWLHCNGEYDTVQTRDQYMCAVAFSPDSRYMACAGADGEIIVVDVPSRTEVRRIRGVHTTYAAVSFDPSGRHLAGITDQSVTIWDTGSWSASKVINGRGLVTDLDYDQDGHRLAIATDGNVSVYSCTTWKPEAQIRGAGSQIRLRFSPRAGQLVTAGADGFVKVWDPQTGRLERSIPGHSAAVRALAFNDDGDTLASSGEDNLIMLWDTRTWTRKRSLPTGDETVYALAYTREGSKLALGGGHTAVELWDTSRQSIETIFDGHMRSVRSVACSPDGAWLASASWDGSAKIWDLRKTRQISFPNMADAANCYALSRNGDVVAGLMPHEALGLWRTATGEQIQSIQATSIISAVAVDDAGRQVAIANNRHISVMDHDGRVKWQFDVGSTWQGVTSIAIAPDGLSIVVGGRRGELETWTFPGKRQDVLADAASGCGITAVAYSADGKLIAAGNQKGAVVLMSLDSGNQMSTFVGHHADITSLAFSHDGREIASSGADNSVKIWNVETSREVLTIDPGDFECSTIAFGGNDLALYAVAFDGRSRSWKSMSAADVAAALHR